MLVLQTMPLSATMVPIYGLARDLDLRNTYLGLILVHSAIEMPFLIWLMKGFFDTIPRYLEEAAWLDGRSKFRAWWEVVMPVARPGIVVIAGFAFLNAWSEVLMVIILVDDPGKYDRSARLLPDVSVGRRLHRGQLRAGRGGRRDLCAAGHRALLLLAEDDGARAYEYVPRSVARRADHGRDPVRTRL